MEAPPRHGAPPHAHAHVKPRGGYVMAMYTTGAVRWRWWLLALLI